LSWREYVFSTLWPYVAEHPLYAPHAPGGGACASALPSREIAAMTCTHNDIVPVSCESFDIDIPCPMSLHDPLHEGNEKEKGRVRGEVLQ
jgi:hypothetical protein